MRVIILFLSILLSTSLSWASSLNVNVKLSPAGSFVAKTSALKGSAKKVGDGFVAQNIIADFTTFKTGVSLRDTHTKKHLETEKYPTAKLLKAKGKGGKGIALMLIRGKKHKVSGTYKIKGKNLICNFTMKLSDLGITGIKYMGVGVRDEIKVEVKVPIS